MKTCYFSYFLFLLFGVFNHITVYAQPDSVVVSEYFSSIHNDENRLRQFFAEMPKGGDLHNHLTGAAYAESYFKFATEDGLWVDMATGKLYQPKDSTKGKEMLRLSPDMPNLHNTRMALIDKWSIRNFNPGKFPLGADEYFFGAFGLFNTVAGKHTVELMQELRKRAARENVQYLEIMLSSPGINAAKIDALCGNDFYTRYNDRLQKAILADTERAKGREGTDKVLDDIFKEWEKIPAMSKWVDKYVAYIDSIDIHSTLSSGYDRTPVCFYQGYASRNAAPLVVYAQLYIAFKSCLREGSKLVGVNIVSAENSEIAMADYTAHMKMFRYLDKATGNRVKTSLHAGELHGGDVAFEEGSISLLDAMQKRQIPVEINLTSNEFILGVKNDAHPFMLYRQAEVPTVLSTDDPGILRTNLAQQYVLAAMRYGLGYYEIKQLVRNSIRFGFMPEKEKQALLKRVEKEFATFEKMWRKNISLIFVRI